MAKDPTKTAATASTEDVADRSATAGGDDSTRSLSYEQARDELADVVRRLEAGGTSLEDSLALWERGEALAARCQSWLEGARHRLDAARPADAPDAG